MKNFDNPTDHVATIVMLAEMPAALADHPMSLASRRNISSAINTFSRVVGLPSSTIPADPAYVQLLVVNATPAIHGIGTARWANVKTEINRALRLLYGDPGNIPLSKAWESVVAAGASATERSMLRRWGRFCSARQTKPQDITEGCFADFIDDLTTVQHSKAPERIAGDTRRFWNRIAKAQPDRLLPSLEVISRSRAYVLPWDAFPASLKADVLAFCSPSIQEQLFSRKKDRRPFSTATAEAYNRCLRRLASAAVHAGVPAGSLTNLAALVTPDTAEMGLGWLANRNGGKPNLQLFYLTNLCLGIARRWAELDDEAIKTLANWSGRFAETKQLGMSPKNQNRLRQFAGEEVLATLVNLPEKIFAKLKGEPITPTHARLARDAVMVALFTIAPMRLKNMRHLDRDQHFRVAFSISDPKWELVLSAAEVKNDRDIAYPIPPHVMDMIDRYLTVYKPLLTKEASTRLFPGRGQEIFSDGGGRDALKRILKRQMGIVMNPHLFRHLSAFIFLKAQPGQFEPVKRLLGHKNIQTTMKFYADFINDESMERYAALLRRRRDSTEG